MSGAVNYHAGLAAEATAERHYLDAGDRIAARRWRGAAGEIDLVVRRGAELIFVEVKKSKDFARAAESLSRRQMERIYNAASEFLSGEPQGQDSAVRFDVALVDGQGRLSVLENAFGA